ncbi:MAG: rhomboid family intramembrane serine protease [bacterium]
MAETVGLYAWHLSPRQVPALISYQFIHFHPYHLLFNMIFLWTFGASLEHLVGRWRFLFYYLAGGIIGGLCQSVVFFVFNPSLADIPQIGASGSVSAVMGVYLVRCYFSRIKTGVSLFGPFFFIPKRFRLSPVILVGFYFLADLVHGIQSLESFVPVGYFAHVGGILTGVLLSLGSRHLKDAHLDKYLKRSQEWIEKGIGLGQARQDLECILEELPGDTRALTQMARVEASLGRHDSAQGYYRKAIVGLWRGGKRGDAAYLYGEFFRRYRQGFKGGFQLSLCRELIKRGDYETASRGLELLIESAPAGASGREGKVLEQAYITQGRLLSDKLGLTEPAIQVFNRFLARFPYAGQREMVSQKIELLKKRSEPKAAPTGAYART